jgi:hypothetical protein
MIPGYRPSRSAAVRPAQLSKDAVLYRVGERDARCGKCRHFIPPANCVIVEGQVTAQGKCERLDTSSTWGN